MKSSLTETTAELLEHLQKVEYENTKKFFAQPWIPGVIVRFLEESERTLLLRLAVVPPLQLANIAEWYKEPSEAVAILKHLSRLHMVRIEHNGYWVCDPNAELKGDMFVDVEPMLKVGIQQIIAGECFVPQELPGTVAVVRPAKERWYNLLNSILEENKPVTKPDKKADGEIALPSGPSMLPAGPSVVDAYMGSAAVPGAIVVTSEAFEEETRAARDFLHEAGITYEQGILPFGFEFMLKDTRTQVLLLLDTCIRKFSGQRRRCEEEDEEERGSSYGPRYGRMLHSSSSSNRIYKMNEKDLVNVLSLVMWLSTLRPGSCYSYSNEPASFAGVRHIPQMLKMLEYLGLVCLDTKEQTLSVTPLLANSVDIRRGFECAESAELFEKNSANIIVESNFNVYAYTSNPRNINLLKLFTRNEKALPGFYVAKLTREAVQRAIKKGITRQLIENFLMKNAHPCLANQKAVIPENVVDQLVIWEREKERYELHLASRVKILDPDAFDRALRSAREAKALLHHTPDTLYIKSEYKEKLLRILDS